MGESLVKKFIFDYLSRHVITEDNITYINQKQRNNLYKYIYINITLDEYTIIDEICSRYNF